MIRFLDDSLGRIYGVMNYKSVKSVCSSATARSSRDLSLGLIRSDIRLLSSIAILGMRVISPCTYSNSTLETWEG